MGNHRCPKCGSYDCDKTILGYAERGASYVVKFGVGAVGKAIVGGLTGWTPSRVGTPKASDIFENQFKCNKCGNTFHVKDE